ncbi:hypothetical protein [Tsukamurella serpentis]
MDKKNALAGSADQVFASLSNGLILYALAVVTGVDDFGFLSLLFTFLAAGIGLLRGALGTPLLLAADRGADGVHAEGRFAVSVAAGAGLVVGAIIVVWTVAGGHPQAIVLGVVAPFVMMQDCLRYVAIGSGAPRVAATWDGLWFAGSAALLVTAWFVPSSLDQGVLISGWAVLGLVAAAGMAVRLRIRPRIAGLVQWCREDLWHRVRFGLDAGLEQLGVLAVLLISGAVIGNASAGALRGAVAVLAPFAVLTAAIPLVVIPAARRSGAAGERTWSLLLKIAVVSAAGALIFGLVAAALPASIGRLLLGETFLPARPVIAVMAVEYAISALLFAISTWLRALKLSRDLLVMKLAHVALALALCTGAAFVLHTALAVAVAIAVSTAIIVAVALIALRPWRPRSVADRPATSTALATSEASPAAGRIPGRSGIRRRRRVLPEPGWKTVIGTWTLVLMAVLIPGLLISTTASPSEPDWLGTLVVTTVVSVRFAFLVGAGERRLFEMTFWVFTYVFMGLAPMAQLRQHSFPDTVLRTDWTANNRATAVVLIGIVAFFVGAALARRRPSTERAALRAGHAEGAGAASPADGGASAGVYGDLSYWRVVALSLVAIAYNVVYLSSVGFAQFAMTRYDAYYNHVAVWGSGAGGVLIRSSVGMTILVAVLALMRLWRIMRATGDPADRKRLWLVGLLLVVAGLLLADTLNPISNARYLAGTAILAVLAALGLFATSARFRVVALGFVCALVLLFPLADAFRYSTSGEFKSKGPLDSLLSADYDSFAQVNNAITIVERDGLSVGRQFLGVLLWFFPRALWPDKPVDSGILIANQRGYRFTNLSAPLWCEAYLNGGIIAVIGVFLVVGYALYRWDTKLDAQLRQLPMPGIIGCVMPFYMLILLRGSLLQAMSYLTVVYLCYLAVRRYPPRKQVMAPAERLIPRSLQPLPERGRP